MRALKSPSDRSSAIPVDDQAIGNCNKVCAQGTCGVQVRAVLPQAEERLLHDIRGLARPFRQTSRDEPEHRLVVVVKQFLESSASRLSQAARCVSV